MHQAFEEELAHETAVFSRREQVHLFCQVAKMILVEVLEDINIDDAA